MLASFTEQRRQYGLTETAISAAFAESLELSIVAEHGRLWCAEMMKCLKDVVPDYAEKVTSLVLNRSVTEIEGVDTEVVLALGVVGGLLVGVTSQRILGLHPRIRYRMRPIIRGWLSVFHSLLSMLIMTVV